MFLRSFLMLFLNFLILLANGNCENCDLDIIHLHLFGQIENVKKSLEILNTRLDVLQDRPFPKMTKNEEVKELQKLIKSIFDIRFDTLPAHCASNPPPSSCAEASECTHTSGIYKITDYRYSNRTFTVYCDYDNYEGDWLYILRRQDGAENFNRPWNDYVRGFGNVAGEYWLGLETLYGLTNFYGPQELMVHVENFEGIKQFARYSNFAIGNAKENYKIKSLGQYSGTAGDSLFTLVGKNFSTYDHDIDDYNDNCAVIRNGGFWYESCAQANPTGSYLRGLNSARTDNLKWKTFGGDFYSHKTIIFMIRRQSSVKLE